MFIVNQYAATRYSSDVDLTVERVKRCNGHLLRIFERPANRDRISLLVEDRRRRRSTGKRVQATIVRVKRNEGARACKCALRFDRVTVEIERKDGLAWARVREIQPLTVAVVRNLEWVPQARERTIRYWMTFFVVHRKNLQLLVRRVDPDVRRRRARRRRHLPGILLL